MAPKPANRNPFRLSAFYFPKVARKFGKRHAMLIARRLHATAFEQYLRSEVAARKLGQLRDELTGEKTKKEIYMTPKPTQGLTQFDVYFPSAMIYCANRWPGESVADTAARALILTSKMGDLRREIEKLRDAGVETSRAGEICAKVFGSK